MNLIAFQPVDKVARWSSLITAAWRETVDGIIGVGRMLIEAREDLRSERGAWGRLIGDNGQESQLPFAFRTTYRLIEIAEDERLLSHATVMPPSWMTLAALTKLDHEQFEEAMAGGIIRPDMERKDIRDFLRRRRKLVEEALIRTIDPTFTVHHCAITDVDSNLVPDGSTDAIITDPPYPQKFLPLFSELARFADRTLKPSGWCVVMTGAVYLPEVIQRLAEKLTYRWQYVVTTPGGSHARLGELGLFQAYKPVLLFQKAPATRIREWWPDVITAKAKEQDKTLHPWQQSETVFSTLVERFSAPGGLIVDPFTGSGTTGRAAVGIGRHFWGCDVDPDCVQLPVQQA